jgi:Ca2+:H+ antiporter
MSQKAQLQNQWLGQPIWALVAPIIAIVVLSVAWGRSLGWLSLILVSASLIAAVLTAVHHAEVIAHKVGEPYGTLILALAVTIIEVSLIVSMMLSGGPATGELARDTVFAAVMIVCTGVIGLCLLVGSIRYHVIEFRVEGSVPTLSVLIALATLTLVLPALTITTPEATFSPAQLAFAGVVSLLLYGVFVLVQTVLHRESFVSASVRTDDSHGAVPTLGTTIASMLLLFVSLIGVVGLAKTLSPSIEAAIERSGAPAGVVGIAIAMLVLLPETWAAVRSASADRMQNSLNLALGSALATIGLTIPAVALVSIVLDMPLVLGLPPKETALLMLTFIVSGLTLASGRATVLQGAVHLVLFAAFLFLAIVP